MRTETMRSRRMTIGKNGFSARAGEGEGGMPWRYLRDGENSLITSGHTFSFSMKLNSGCCDTDTYIHTHTHKQILTLSKTRVSHPHHVA